MTAKKQVTRSAPDDRTHVALDDIIRRLAAHYGPPPAPFPGEPFAMILWEQVAYLATDAKRRIAFNALTSGVGVTPLAIARAKPATLTAIARLGGAVAADLRAQRIVTSAERVLSEHDGDLAQVLALPVAKARAALAAFPMIGEPGADKILAWSGAAQIVPLDSNALRVVTRLGLVSEAKDYRAWYRAARAAVTVPARASARWGADAGQLLRQHGQVTCRRSAPRCAACALRERCPSAGG